MIAYFMILRFMYLTSTLVATCDLVSALGAATGLAETLD